MRINHNTNHYWIAVAIHLFIYHTETSAESPILFHQTEGEDEKNKNEQINVLCIFHKIYIFIISVQVTHAIRKRS